MEKKIQELESNKKDPGSANCSNYLNNYVNIIILVTLQCSAEPGFACNKCNTPYVYVRCACFVTKVILIKAVA